MAYIKYKQIKINKCICRIFTNTMFCKCIGQSWKLKLKCKYSCKYEKKPVAYLEAQKGTNTNTIANTNSMFCKCTGQSRRLSHVCLLVCARGEVCTLPSSWNIQYHRKYLCSYIFSICIYFCFSICVFVCRYIT